MSRAAWRAAPHDILPRRSAGLAGWLRPASFNQPKCHLDVVATGSLGLIEHLCLSQCAITMWLTGNSRRSASQTSDSPTQTPVATAVGAISVRNLSRVVGGCLWRQGRSRDPTRHFVSGPAAVRASDRRTRWTADRTATSLSHRPGRGRGMSSRALSSSLEREPHMDSFSPVASSGEGRMMIATVQGLLLGSRGFEGCSPTPSANNGVR